MLTSFDKKSCDIWEMCTAIDKVNIENYVQYFKLILYTIEKSN